MAASTRVLIVDDDPDYTDILNHNLCRFADRYRVDSVATFEAGLNAIRQGDYDVYLVDYQLDAGRTGDVLVDEASSHLRPIVMLTSVESEDLGDRVMRAGASDYVVKQHATAEMVDRAIRSALERRARLRRILQRQRDLKIGISRDSLTGLITRSYLKQKINKKLRAVPHQGALLYLDLDGFKPINDLHGHDAGDRIMQMIAARLIQCVQPSDIVGRFGGDEFLIYLQLDAPGRPPTASTRSIAQKLLASVARPYRIAMTKGAAPAGISLGLSIGIAVTATKGIEYEELVGMAHEAVYHAKKNGKNGFAYH